MTPKLSLAVLAALSLASCSREAAPPAPPPAPPPVAAPAPAPAPAAEPAKPAEAAPATVTATATATAQAPAPAAVPAPRNLPAPKQGAEANPVPTQIAVRGKVGDAKCRMCHKLQHDSWSASPHAAKGLDCEGCHGGGAEFTKVMRDRTAAIAAGLVLPKKEFCKGCHKKDWQDAMFLRVHAHKVK